MIELNPIQGVKVIPLKQILDDRGKIMHMLKSTDSHFEKFGEIYFSTAEKGVVKGWHLHKEMTLNYACILGKIKLVLYDDREESITKWNIMELFLSPENYQLVVIPPGIWNGWKGLGEFNMISNCATLPHNPNEMECKHPYLSDDIPYDWNRIY